MDSSHRGGVSIVYREDTGWQVEGATRYGMNVVSFKITVGRKHWYISRSYLPPNDQQTVHRV